MVKCGSELMVSIEIVHLAFRLIEFVLALEEQVLFIRNQKFFSSHVKSWVVRNKTKFVSFIFGGHLVLHCSCIIMKGYYYMQTFFHSCFVVPLALK